jgi:Fe-S-cluster containining protein
VPIAEAEVYQIAELVESMPEPKRSVIKQRFADGVEHFRSIGWFSRINDEFSGDGPKDSKQAAAKAMEVVLDYFREGIPCPFLEDESCSIHPSRPLSCREYLVTTPAENCASPTAETIRRVEMMAQPSKALKQFTATEQMKGEGLVTLIRALELAEKFADNYPEKTGDVWMSEFFGSLAKAGKPTPTEAPAFKSRLKKHSRWRK